jgi:hypothetical protein
LFADLEARVEQLKASEVDMNNLFYREKDAREVLEYDYKQLAHECNMHMELQIASDPVDVVAGGLAANCTDEQYTELLEQMAPIAEQVAEELNLQ